MRHVRLREYLVAVEGLALFRHLFVGDDADVAARIDEVREIVADPDHPTYAQGIEVPELDPRAGYTAWSGTYDHPGNPLISVEEPAVRMLLDALPAGRALDAACGTGRHSEYLAGRGHDVVGVDASPEMLARTTARVPGARFVHGDLEQLPLGAGTVDLAVCALALGHLPELPSAIGELARVVRPGGRVVVTDLHPTMRASGAQAFFTDARGVSAFVREHPHLHGDYLRAFDAAGLEVRQCLEPTMGDREVAMQALGNAFVPDATRAAFLGLPNALVWELAR